MSTTKTKTIARSFIGCKIVNAIPMTKSEFARERGERLTEKHDLENEEGYKLTYPDGYVSWSPKNVFDNAYREVSVDERKLLS